MIITHYVMFIRYLSDHDLFVGVPYHILNVCAHMCVFVCFIPHLACVVYHTASGMCVCVCEEVEEKGEKFI